MKRNICVVTWLGGGNFGTSLQSYALHNILEKLGYDVSLLLSFDESDFTLPFIKRIKREIRRWLDFIRHIRNTVFNVKYRRLNRFNTENYNIRRVSTRKQLTNLLEATDVFITGSDQIWNCYHHFDKFYFLSFAGNIKRIAYASSMGTLDFPDEYKEEVIKLLSKFQHISVREETARNTIASLLSRDDVIQVLDPTFLIERQEWERFAAKGKIKELPPEYILSYFIGGKDRSSQVEDVANKAGIKNIIEIPSLENSKGLNRIKCTVCSDAGPYEFVQLINNATVICTDSFHATALSIILEKDFVEFKRFDDNSPKSQNTRLYDLLSHYDLSDRIYNDTMERVCATDYTSIREKINEDRNVCLRYLTQSIEN